MFGATAGAIAGAASRATAGRPHPADPCRPRNPDDGLFAPQTGKEIRPRLQSGKNLTPEDKSLMAYALRCVRNFKCRIPTLDARRRRLRDLASKERSMAAFLNASSPRPRQLPVAIIAVIGLAGIGGTAENKPIFDGRSLEEWSGTADRWRVEDGAITAEIRDGEKLDRNEFLWWDGAVGDFELALEYRIEGHPSANSGIQYRSQRLPDGHAAGYQADLDDGAKWLGRIYDEHGRGLLVERGVRLAIAPDGRTWTDTFAGPDAIRAVVRADAWNRYRIRATAAHVTVWVNDTLASVLDDRDAEHAAYSGRLALQLHSGLGPVKLWFRDIRLTDLGATAPAAGDAPSAAKPSRSGRDWSSPALWHTIDNRAATPQGTHAAATNERAAATVAGIKVTPGFRVDLVAAEPDIHQPIAFAIDPRGRLWVVEGHSYPTKRPDGQGLDRIVILADGDGDGTFETRNVFKEGLNLVSGIELGFGGVFVGAAPHLLFIPDRDGDDRPDGEPEILLDGWGFQDTHETLNSFTWGPDGWLYGCHGVFTSSAVGPPGTPRDERLPINAGIWRYHPSRKQFEIFAHGGSNQWGIDFTSVGDAFMTHCRSFHGGGGTTHVLRNGIYWNQANAGFPPFICHEAPAFAPDLKNYLPAAARYDSGEGGAGKKGSDAVYGGHSHVGTMVYLGDNWPEIYRDRIFTHNLHGRQMNHQEAVRQGSGYEVFHAGHDILHAPDETYVAVDLQYGPDGAVYAIDWSDRQHCHNPATEIWDRSNGRLYRMAWAETFRPVAVNLAAKTDAELVALHAHRNEWFVRTARRLLQERAVAGTIAPATLEPLRGMASSPDAVTALRGLWTLHVTGALDDAGLARAFAHADDRVRGWAVTLATEVPGSPRIPLPTLLAAAQTDPSSLVRRSLASALPALPPTDRWTLGAALAMHGEDAADRFLPKLIWSGIAPLVDADRPRAAALAAATPIESLADSIDWYLGRSPEGRRLLVAEMAQQPPAKAARLLDILDFSLATAGAVPPPEGWTGGATRFTTGHPQKTARRLSAVFGDASVLAAMRATLADRAAALADRKEAFALLSRVGDKEAVPIFVALLDDPEFRGSAVPLASRSSDPAVATKLLAAYPSLTEKDRRAVVTTLASRPAFARPLVEAIEAGRFPRDGVTAVQLRQLRGLDDAEIRAALDRVYGRVNESPAAAKATMARLKGVWTGAPKWALDRARGRAVFEKACASCHTHGDAGGKLGPNLTGAWMNGPDYFVENLVDPNAVVGPDYQLTTVVTDDGRSIGGIIAAETPESLVLRTPEGQVTLPLAAIEERTTSAVSLMPSGILESLPEDEFLALIAFLIAKP
jgi:putative membrane-bound dehydrogenase-like protein